MKRMIGVLFAIVVLASSAFAAGSAVTSTAGAKAVPAKVIEGELNTAPPVATRAMVATGETNAEGNTMRARNVERNMVMSGEGNTVVKQASGTVETNGVRVSAGKGMRVETNVSTGAQGNGVRVATVNMADGRQLRVQIEENGAIIETDGIKVKTNTRVRVEGNVMISERSGKPIKVDPARVVEQVKNQIRVQNVERVELVDDGQGPMYVVKANEQARIFGIIPVEVPVDAEINAENGAVVAVKKPWWAFLAIG